MTLENQQALMEGILFPHYKVQNTKRASHRRLLSRKKYLQRQATNLSRIKYLQRQATNLSKSFPKIESLQNEISIVSFQNESSAQPAQLPNYGEKENFVFVTSCLLIFTTIICLFFGVFSDITSEAYHFICA